MNRCVQPGLRIRNHGLAQPARIRLADIADAAARRRPLSKLELDA